jgi:hypothetical protein|tara:strand:- start:197 stop:502 length:306 start_codon:yes stop_codon:yes gene_type:complete
MQTTILSIGNELRTIFDTGWKLTHNSEDCIVYTSITNAFEEFRVSSIYGDKIKVSVPMPNSEVLYNTILSTPDETCDFIRNHLENIKINIENLSINYSDDE